MSSERYSSLANVVAGDAIYQVWGQLLPIAVADPTESPLATCRAC